MLTCVKLNKNLRMFLAPLQKLSQLSPTCIGQFLSDEFKTLILFSSLVDDWSITG